MNRAERRHRYARRLAKIRRWVKNQLHLTGDTAEKVVNCYRRQGKPCSCWMCSQGSRPDTKKFNPNNIEE